MKRPRNVAMKPQNAESVCDVPSRTSTEDVILAQTISSLPAGVAANTPNAALPGDTGFPASTGVDGGRTAGDPDLTGMLGQHLAALFTPPKRWVYRLWGQPDVHARQKWRLLWPALRSVSPERLYVVDAGCGAGLWTLELAARCPAWRIVGLDRDPKAIALAERSRSQLALANATFVEADFLEYTPSTPADIVLSVAAAHYLADAGRGPELFATFSRWLRGGGRLVLLAPRATAEIPRWRSLPPPFHSRAVFTAKQLRTLCDDAELRILSLAPGVGRWGVLAKQINCAVADLRPLVAMTYPLQIALDAIDAEWQPAGDAASAAWVLIAERSLKEEQSTMVTA